MVPILLGLNSIIWYNVVKLYRHDRNTGPYPQNPLFDHDLDKLWDSTYIPVKKLNNSDKQEDIQIQRDFEQWLEREYSRDKTLEDYLWYEGILNPYEVVWVEGEPLDPGNPQDYERFIELKDRALLEGLFHSKALDEGGLDDLYTKWFMMKGCSDYGAQQLMASGVKPWEFEYDL